MEVTKAGVENAIDSLAEMHNILFPRLDDSKFTREIYELYWHHHKTVHDTLIYLLREKE